jgi:predicted NAD/FAD-dependent oxidoreductase
MRTNTLADVIIVGAGLSGLMAASILDQSSDKRIVVLDKGRSVGGRMATRRIGDGIADHGAQFFTVREPEFKALVENWLALDLVYQWSLGFSDGSLTAMRDDGYPRMAVREGMNALTKHIASGFSERVEVITGVQVEQVTRNMESWVVRDDEGRQYIGRALALTAPVPQSLQLVGAGKVALHAEDRKVLEAVTYEPCLTGLFIVEGQVRLPEPGAVQRRNSPIAWIANNKQKGISPVPVLTVQADGPTSTQLWDADDQRILKALVTDMMVYLPNDTRIVQQQLKRWRYSRPRQNLGDRFLRARDLPPLFFAGDAFGGPRVEGAVLSGLATGEALAKL